MPCHENKLIFFDALLRPLEEVFDARRLVIPYLVDTSGTRIDAGSLTSDVAFDYVQSYRPSVIVTSPLRLGKLDGFMRRLPEIGYRLERSYTLGWHVYVRE